MVSLRVLLVTALVVIAACNVEGTITKSPKPIISSCKLYYGYYRWTLGGILGQVGRLVSDILNVVGGLINTVGNVLGGVLSLLGLGGSSSTSITFEQYLVKPNSSGSVIYFSLRLCLALKPILDKIQIGFGKLYLRICVAGIILGASARGQRAFVDLNIKLLTGSKANWLKNLNILNLKNDWQNWLSDNNIDISYTQGPRGTIFSSVNALVEKIFSGVDALGAGLLNEVLELLYGVNCLVGSLVNTVFDDLLGVSGEYCGEVLYGVSRTTFEANIRRKYSGYSSDNYYDCFNRYY